MKRMITILGISIGITAIGLITGTWPILLAIGMIISVIIDLKLLFETRKYYNKLLTHIEYVKLLEHERHKAYFIYHGEALKEKIASYDKSLEKAQNLTDAYIEYLEFNKKYLGEKRNEKVLEIAKEIRKPDRA